MKSTALLAAAIFLICAPSPDSRTLSEISLGFLSQLDSEPLLAADATLTRKSITGLEDSESPLEDENDPLAKAN